jgi:hypothetical protein
MVAATASTRRAADTPHDDFHFSVAATWRDWTGGRITEETAMEAIGTALAELREAQEEEAQQ